MKRRRKTPKRRRGECFIAFQFWELESPAFLALSADPVRVYLELRKRLSFDASINGHVPFSHRDAARVLHAGWRRGSNALAELAHFGFVKCREPGEPGPGIRPASEWQLTAFPCGGQAAAKDFMRHDGTVFEPPYRRSENQPEKQPPVFTGKTPRRHREDATLPDSAVIMAENAQSVVTVKTESMEGRRRREDTITDTSHGGTPCPRCRHPRMERRTRDSRPLGARFWHRPWLVCPLCKFSVFDRAHEQTGDWRKPTYVELPAPKPRRPRNSSTAWPAPERQRLGLTQAELARRAGIERPYLAVIEQGRRQPSAAIRDALAAALRITGNGRANE
jgi:DNA-binding XRE family transcriptional regulator